MVFGQEDRSLSNIPRPPSSRIRAPFWNPQQAQAQLSSLTAGGQSARQQYQQLSALPMMRSTSATGMYGGVENINNNNHASSSTARGGGSRSMIQHPSPFNMSNKKRGSLSMTSPRRPSSAISNTNMTVGVTQEQLQQMSEFRSQSVATPVTPMKHLPTVPKSFDAAEEIMGNLTPAEYVKQELDSFEALKRRHLATTLEHDPQHPDLEVQELKLKKDKFAQHQKDKEMIRLANGRRNHKISDGFVNFRGRTYLKYIVPLESTMTRTMRWLFDLRELNVHPVTRLLREHQVSVEHLSQEWLRTHIGAGNKEAGTSIPCDAMTRFIQDHVLKSVYVTQAQCSSWYELLCDKKGTSLDFAAAMTKLSLTLPPEIDDTISAWFTRMIFSGAYIMFRVGDNCTPAELFYIVDALETLVDASLKRGSIEHRLRDTPSTTMFESGGGGGGGAGGGININLATSHINIRDDEFNSNTPQGIMRLLAVVRADIDAYANAISSRAVRRVDDVLLMFSQESTLPRLMKCGEYSASNSKYHAMAMKKLHLAKQARERAISRTRSLLLGRRLSNDQQQQQQQEEEISP